MGWLFPSKTSEAVDNVSRKAAKAKRSDQTSKLVIAKERRRARAAGGLKIRD